MWSFSVVIVDDDEKVIEVSDSDSSDISSDATSSEEE